MTEHDVQNIVAAAVQQPRDLAIVPNCSALGHESDLIRVTDKRMAHDFEIKVSRSDFLADRKKVLRNWKLDNPEAYAWRVPNYFWYALVAGIATEDELPDYAGLLVVDPERHRASVERRASRLHDSPVTDRVFEYLLRGQRIRYWQERDGINPVREHREYVRRAEREFRERQKERRREYAELQRRAEEHA